MTTKKLMNTYHFHKWPVNLIILKIGDITILSIYKIYKIGSSVRFRAILQGKLMVLSDRDIKKALKSKRVVFKPALDLKSQLGSCSVDLRLGNSFRIFKHSRYPYIDPR